MITKHLSVSLRQAEFGVESREYVHELGCYISLVMGKKKRFVDLILLSDTSNIATIPISEGDLQQKVQFIFKRLSTNESVGSISLLTDSLLVASQVKDNSFLQWMTLFKDEKSDEFNGKVDEINGSTLPRVQLLIKSDEGQDGIVSKEEKIDTKKVSNICQENEEDEERVMQIQNGQINMTDSNIQPIIEEQEQSSSDGDGEEANQNNDESEFRCRRINIEEGTHETHENDERIVQEQFKEIEETDEEHQENYDSMQADKKKKQATCEERFFERVVQGLKRFEEQKKELDYFSSQANNQTKEDEKALDKHTDQELFINATEEHETVRKVEQKQNLLGREERITSRNIRDCNQSEYYQEQYMFTLRDIATMLNGDKLTEIDSSISSSDLMDKIKSQIQIQIIEKTNLEKELRVISTVKQQIESECKGLRERLAKEEKLRLKLDHQLAETLEEFHALESLGQLVAQQKNSSQVSKDLHSEILSELAAIKQPENQTSTLLQDLERSAQEFEKQNSNLLNVISEKDGQISLLLGENELLKQKLNESIKANNEFQVKLKAEKDIAGNLREVLIVLQSKIEQSKGDPLEEEIKLVKAECLKHNVKSIVRLSSNLYQLDGLYVQSQVLKDNIVQFRLVSQVPQPFESLFQLLQNQRFQLNSTKLISKQQPQNNTQLKEIQQKGITQSMIQSLSSNKNTNCSSFHSASTKENTFNHTLSVSREKQINSTQPLTNHTHNIINNPSDYLPQLISKQSQQNQTQQMLSSRIVSTPSMFNF